MKNKILINQELEMLSQNDMKNVSGGGFAYDFGRALRFVYYASSGVAGVAEAIYDAAASSVQCDCE